MKEAAFCNRLLTGNGEVLAESREMDGLTKEEQKRAGEALLERLSLFEAFQSFVGGEMDLSALFFYVSACVVFVVLTVQSMEKRRWSE